MNNSSPLLFDPLFKLHSSILEKISFRTTVRVTIGYWTEVLVLFLLTILLSSFCGELWYTLLPLIASEVSAGKDSNKYWQLETSKCLSHRKYHPQHTHMETVCILCQISHKWKYFVHNVIGHWETQWCQSASLTFHTLCNLKSASEKTPHCRLLHLKRLFSAPTNYNQNPAFLSQANVSQHQVFISFVFNETILNSHSNKAKLPKLNTPREWIPWKWKPMKDKFSKNVTSTMKQKSLLLPIQISSHLFYDFLYPVSTRQHLL